MTTDAERLAQIDVRLEEMDRRLVSVEENQQRLVAIANQGKGALRTFLLIGGMLASLAAAAAWVFAWVIDHLK